MRNFGLVLFLMFLNVSTEAQTAQEFSPLVKQAYQQVWKYNLSEAENLLVRDKNQSFAHIYVTDAKWFLQVFATEDPALYKSYIAGTDKRLEQIEAASKKLPFYFFARGEIYLHSALIKLKFGDYTSAAWEINKAYKTFKEGNQKYPDFLLIKRDLYLLQALVGTVPENYTWMLKIIGFEGNLKLSMQRYAEVTKAIKIHPEYNIFLHETQLIQAYLTNQLLNNQPLAWQLMDEATSDYATNPVSAFARANLALHQKRNEEALLALNHYKAEIPLIPHLDYYLGVAKLQRGDADASFYFSRYIKYFKGNNYIKDAYLKLGWAFLLNGDTKNYKNSMVLVQRYGKAILEDDKNAVREAKKTQIPSAPLLKARLLFDGGYNRKALESLKNTDPSNFATEQQAEYHYRMGRIHEAMQLHDEALENYGTVIEKFSALQTYFAPAACYFSGMIYEKKKDKEKARYFYKKCQQYKNYIYKDSFDQKALAGLKRLD